MNRPDQWGSEKVVFAGYRILSNSKHLELSFTSFRGDWAEVGVAGSQDSWFLLGQAASSWSALAQALHTPGLHSPTTGHRALGRGKTKPCLSLQRL